MARVLAIDLDDHFHVCDVVLRLLRKEGNLYLEQIIAKLCQFTNDDSCRPKPTSAKRYVPIVTI